MKSVIIIPYNNNHCIGGSLSTIELMVEIIQESLAVQVSKTVFSNNLFPGHINNNTSANYRYQSPNHTPFIRMKAVYFPRPYQGHDNKNATVSRVHPPETGGLPRGYYTVKNQDNTADNAPPNGFIVFQPLPDEVAAADLAEACAEVFYFLRFRYISTALTDEPTALIAAFSLTFVTLNLSAHIRNSASSLLLIIC